MAATNKTLAEGVFAINKPQGLSSAQVLRDLQTQFNPSKLFAPWISQELKKRRHEERNQRGKKHWRKKAGAINVKLGHGGTLDPLATGVLIVGVGTGTKSLSKFLDCTKTYEAVVLFGTATESYDRMTKIIARKGWEHITREVVEKALEGFRGKIMQRPPMFSALRMEGKRLYEYAREGKELPSEIVRRPVEVTHLELLEWMPAGAHGYKEPEEEAAQEEKAAASSILHQLGTSVQPPDDAETPPQSNLKRTGSPSIELQADAKRLKGLDEGQHVEEMVAETRPDTDNQADIPMSWSNDESASTAITPPAVRLRMTVTSGFYVRSLAHDLGEAVGSLAHMSELVRTRQERFELGKNVLAFEDMAKGEDIWGPQVESMLTKWVEESSVSPRSKKAKAVESKSSS